MAGHSIPELLALSNFDLQPSTPANAPSLNPLQQLTQQLTPGPNANSSQDDISSNPPRSSTCGKRNLKRSRAMSDDDKENQDPLSTFLQGEDSYVAYGRAFARNGDIYTDVNMIVLAGIRHDTADSESDLDEELAHDAKDIRDIDSWKLLCDVIPSFRHCMIDLAEEKKMRRRICREINSGVECARSDDTSSLKGAIIRYLLLNTTASLDPAIAATGQKQDRGWVHPITAFLLCPIKYDTNESTYARIKKGELEVNADMLPRFFFPDGWVYDVEGMASQCFLGHLLFRVAKHVFQGPSTALEGPGFRRGKRGNAAIIGLTTMTPRTIAYIAVQTRFAISSVHSWEKMDATFNYEQFYWNIVGMFEDGAFSDVIEKYNHQIFGPTKNIIPTADASLDAPSDFEIMRVQHLAKRARVDANK